MADKDKLLREHLVYLLRDGGAHAKFDDVVADFPVELRGKKVKNLPYSAWMLLEHMRLAQWDILEFSRNKKHVSPAWPEGYWPKAPDPPDAAAWAASVRQFRKDLKAMEALVSESEDGFVRQDSMGRWADNPPRDIAGRGSQCVSPRRVIGGAAVARGMESLGDDPAVIVRPTRRHSWPATCLILS